LSENIEHYWFLVSADTEFNSIPRGTRWCNVNAPHTHEFSNTDWALFITCGACPFPSDPRNRKCSDCITNLAGRTDTIFMNTITRWSDLSIENLITDTEFIPIGWEYHYKEAEVSALLFETCLNGRFDVFENEVCAERGDTVLVHNCGTCRNPMNSRWEECFYCIQNGAKTVGTPPEFVTLVKMATQELWPLPDKSVFSIEEKILGMSREDVERINEIIRGIENTDDLIEKILFCDEGIRINDTVPVLWGLKGEFLYYRHKVREALSCYERAVQLDPDNSVVWFNKGVILKNLGRVEDALKCFEKALSLKPHDTHASSMRVQCLQALGRPVAPFQPKDKRCPSCGIDVPVHAQFCYNCGTPISSKVVPKKMCTSCGCRIPVAAQFCPYCGRSVSRDLTRLY